MPLTTVSAQFFMHSNIAKQSNRFREQCVVVTGGGSGIGAEVAQRFAAEGAHVIIIDVRYDLAKKVENIISENGGISEAHECDVTDEQALNDIVEGVVRKRGLINTLVTSAGIIMAGVVHETSLHDWNHILNVNLTGAFLSIRSVLPTMMAQRQGSIITIGSIASRVIGAGGGSAGYEASKAGLSQLTRAVAVEYSHYGIRANCICPGKITTDLAVHEKELDQNLYTSTRTLTRPKYKERLIPSGNPSEIASLAVFLASGEVPFINGTDIFIDGGYLAI